MFYLRLTLFLFLSYFVFWETGIITLVLFVYFFIFLEGLIATLKLKIPFIFKEQEIMESEHLCEQEDNSLVITQTDLDELEFSTEPVTLQEAILTQKIVNNDYEALFTFLTLRCLNPDFPFEDAPLELIEILAVKLINELNSEFEKKEQSKTSDMFVNEVEPKQIH